MIITNSATPFYNQAACGKRLIPADMVSEPPYGCLFLHPTYQFFPVGARSLAYLYWM